MWALSQYSRVSLPCGMVWQFLTVVDIGGRDSGAVSESGFAIHANVYLHGEVPLVNFTIYRP
jgi:hypothetical protein